MRFQSNVPDKIKNKKRPTWREINRRPLLYILYYALLSRDLTEFLSALVKKKQGQNSKILSLPSPHTAAHTEASTTLTPHQIFRTFTQREKRLVLKKTNSFSHFFFLSFFLFWICEIVESEISPIFTVPSNTVPFFLFHFRCFIPRVKLHRLWVFCFPSKFALPSYVFEYMYIFSNFA